MQLPIETWAANAQLPAEATEALHEAAICYRARAYRAALLFSYVAWGLVLKSRILGARSAPSGFPVEKWKKLCKEVRNDDRWDGALFDATQTIDPVSIFHVTEDLRAQVRYWKDRRNDCAHAKQNVILASHVETLWAFLWSNLDKFAVGGSREDLVARTRDHFDTTLTPPNAPCDDLVQAITSAIPRAERKEFFESTILLFQRKLGNIVYWHPNAVRYFEAVFRVDDRDILEPALEVVLADIDLLARILLAQPQLCHLISRSPKTVRQLWQTKLAGKGEQSTCLYVALLRNALIPPNEIDEANEYIVKKVFLPPPATSENAQVLKTSGMMVVLRRVAFVEGKLDIFEWGNKNAELVAWYIDRCPIDDEIARALCTFFSSHRSFPTDAAAALKALFSGNEAKRNEFADVISRLGLEAPEPLLG